MFYRIVKVLLDELIARSLEPKSAKMMLRRSVDFCMSIIVSIMSITSVMSVIDIIVTVVAMEL